MNSGMKEGVCFAFENFAKDSSATFWLSEAFEKDNSASYRQNEHREVCDGVLARDAEVPLFFSDARSNPWVILSGTTGLVRCDVRRCRGGGEDGVSLARREWCCS